MVNKVYIEQQQDREWFGVTNVIFGMLNPLGAER